MDETATPSTQGKSRTSATSKTKNTRKKSTKNTTGKAAPKTASAKPKTTTAKKPATKKVDYQNLNPQKVANATVSQQQRHEMIEKAAYLIAERRGFFGGNPKEDWLQAEMEIDAFLAKELSPTDSLHS